MKNTQRSPCDDCLQKPSEDTCPDEILQESRIKTLGLNVLGGFWTTSFSFGRGFSYECSFHSVKFQSHPSCCY